MAEAPQHWYAKMNDEIAQMAGPQLVVPVLKSMGPASVKVCVLLRKDRPAEAIALIPARRDSCG